MSAMPEPPVAVFVFNRPAFTRRLLEQLRIIRPRRLLVVADGPRPSSPGDVAACAEVRALFDDVGWPCEVERELSEKNLGCGRRMSSGLDWVFSRAEEAILLEDDCIPHPSFFSYCGALLERFRDDERVGHIAGTNLLGSYSPDASSYFFSVRADVWGWATWRRAWRHYDYSLSSWPQLRRQGALGRAIPGLGLERQLTKQLDRVYAGELDTWDYQWQLTMLLQRMLQVVPAVNLVSNVGFGSDATHASGSHPAAGLATHPMDEPLRHPREVLPSLEYEESTLRLTDSLGWRLRSSAGKVAARMLWRAAERLR